MSEREFWRGWQGPHHACLRSCIKDTGLYPKSDEDPQQFFSWTFEGSFWLQCDKCLVGGGASIGAGRSVVGGRCWALGWRGWGDRKKCTNTRGFLEAKSTRLCDELEVGEEREVFKDSTPLSQVSKLRLREGNFFVQGHTASVSTRISTYDCPMSKLTCFLQH